VTVERLDALLPPFWSRTNPVDIVGATQVTHACLDILMQDENTDAILCIGTPGARTTLAGREANIPADRREQARHEIEERTRAIAEGTAQVIERMEQMGKPLLIAKCSPTEDRFNPQVTAVVYDHNCVLYPTPEVAATALANMARYAEYLRREA
jgi:acyl-CoA synthetase (NDP forming)